MLNPELMQEPMPEFTAIEGLPDAQEAISQFLDAQDFDPEPMPDFDVASLRVKPSEKQLDELGKRVQQMIYSSDAEKGKRTQWWARMFDSWRNNLGGESLYPDTSPGIEYSRIHIPFLQPRIDRLVTGIVGVVARQDPYMVAVDGADIIDADVMENFLHRLWRDAGFPAQVEKAATIAALTNLAVMTIGPRYEGPCKLDTSYSQGESPSTSAAGIDIGVLNPEDIDLYGEAEGDFGAMMLVGHSFNRRFGYIREMCEAGDWHGPATHSGSETGRLQQDAQREAGASYETNLDADDYQTTLNVAYVKWTFKKSGKKMWHKVILDKVTGHVYRVEKCPFPRPPYFGFSLLQNLFGVWPDRSIARNLYPLEYAQDNIHSLIYNGSVMAANPVLTGIEAKDGSKDTRVQPGQIVETEGTPSALNNRFDGQWLWQMAANNERIGDQVARVSQDTMGTSSSSDKTATQASIVASGVQASIDDCIGVFVTDLGAMAQLTLMVAALIRKDIVATWGEQDIPSVEALTAPVLFQAAGRSASATPAAKMEVAQMLSAMAQDPEYGFNKREIGRMTVMESPASSMIDKIQPPIDPYAQTQQAGSGGGPLGVEQPGAGPDQGGGNAQAGGMPAQGQPAGPLTVGNAAV